MTTHRGSDPRKTRASERHEITETQSQKKNLVNQTGKPCKTKGHGG